MKSRTIGYLAAFALAASGFGFGVEAASAPPDKALCNYKVCQTAAADCRAGAWQRPPCCCWH